jgi:hypothetical protein
MRSRLRNGYSESVAEPAREQRLPLLHRPVEFRIVESRGDIIFGESRSAALTGLGGEHVLHRVVW